MASGTNQLDLIGSGNSTVSSIDRVGFGGTATTALVKNGTGKWTITGNVTDTGATTISGGTLEYQGSVSSSSITNNAALIFNSGSNRSYGNVISGAGTLTKQGGGTLTLSGANIYTGATTISGGTLEVQGSITSSGITNNAALIFNSGSNQSYGNAISGNGTLTKQGGGTLTLSGTNSYAGATTISGGTLRLSSVGTSNAVSIANHSFENPVTASFITAPSLAAQGGTGWTFTGSSGVARTTWFVNTPPDGVQAGFIQATAGTISQVITAGANGYYRINFQAQGRGGNFGPEGVIVQLDGVTVGTWTAAEVSQSVWNSFSAPVNLTAGSHTLTFLGNNTIGGDRSVSIDNVQMNQPIGSLPSNTAVNLTTSGAILDMNFTNQTIGSLTGVAGTSVINGAISIGGTDNTTFAGVISGGSSLSITGGGTQTLSGANSYTGATNVNNGTLLINGSTSTSTVTVANGATLGGNNGTIGGATTVNGTLSPGNSTGTLSFTNTLSLGATSTYLFELNNTTNAADLTDVTGALNISNSAILDLVQLGAYTVGDRFTLFAYDSTLTGAFAGIADGAEFTDAGGLWRMDYNDTLAGLNGGTGNSYVTITAIPEPSAALLGGLGLLALLRRRR